MALRVASTFAPLAVAQQVRRPTHMSAPFEGLLAASRAHFVWRHRACGDGDGDGGEATAVMAGGDGPRGSYMDTHWLLEAAVRFASVGELWRRVMRNREG